MEQNKTINNTDYLKQYNNQIISIHEWYEINNKVEEFFICNINGDSVKLNRKYNDNGGEFEGSEVYNIIVKDLSLTNNKFGKEKEQVNHPSHYGGKDNPYEVIKVIRAWGLGFNLGNTIKYISRAGKKDPNKIVEDLKKALWYLDDEIKEIEKQNSQKT